MPGNNEKLASRVLAGVLLLGLVLVWQKDASRAFSNDYNEGVYLCSARSLSEGNELFTRTFCSQPPMLVEVLTVWRAVFGEGVIIGRSLILLSAVICVGAAALVAGRMAGLWAVPGTVLFLGISTPMFLNCRTIQAEMPALASAMTALAATSLLAGRRLWAAPVAGGALFAIACLFKLLVAPMLLPLTLLLLVSPESGSGRWRLAAPGGSRSPDSVAGAIWWRRIATSDPFKRVLLLGVSGAAGTLFLISHHDWGLLYDQSVRFHFAAHDVFPKDWARNAMSLSNQAMRNAGICLFALSGMVTLAVRNPLACAWLGFWLLGCGYFLLDHSPLLEQHIALIAPPVAIAASGNLLWIRRLVLGSTWGKLSIYLLMLPFLSLPRGPIRGRVRPDLVLISSLREFSTSFLAQDREVITLIQKETAPSDYVVTDQQMFAYLADRPVPPDLCDTSRVRITSGYLTDAEAIHETRQYNAKMVVLRTGRLGLLTGFVKWVEANYELIRDDGALRVFVKRGV